MTNNEIKEILKENAETKYRNFSSSLVTDKNEMLGVRIPILRTLAKQISKDDWRLYLHNAESDTFEEVMLQGLVIGYGIKEPEECMKYLDDFIPKITNWSINDSVCSTCKIVKKNKKLFLPYIDKHASSGKEFEMRFAVTMLLFHFLDSEYIDDVLKRLNQWHHDGYYFKMAVAWTIATAYAKFPTKAQLLLEDNSLDDFTYNKAISKMLESYRITPEDKLKLRAMKREVSKNGSIQETKRLG